MLNFDKPFMKKEKRQNVALLCNIEEYTKKLTQKKIDI